MRNVYLILLLLLISNAYADFSITGIDINVKVDKKGNAEVVERISIFIEGGGYIASYNKYLENPTLAAWQELLGSSEVRVHLNREEVNIKDLKVRPQPISNYDPLTKRGEGEIIILYKAERYQNSTGLFEVKQIKPRTYRLILNEKALYFETTSEGNLVINSKTTLTFIPPPNSLLIDINPIPVELRDKTFPIEIDKVSWHNVILVNPVLIFEYEETIGDEIYSFFEETTQRVIDFVETDEGKVVVTFIILIFIFYSTLQYKIRKMREGENAK